MRAGAASVLGCVTALAFGAAAARAASPLHTARGAPVHWAGAQVRVAADAAHPSRTLASAAVGEAITEAGDAWNQVPELPVRFTPVDAGAADVRVRFCKGTWTAAAGLLANSEYEADPVTGAVHAAVIVINECDYRFVGPSEVEDGAFDLQAVITHELGHVLGLGHSADPKAVMFPSTGTVRQRRPGDDDRNGLQALYGSRAAAPDGGAAVVPSPSLAAAAPSLLPPLVAPLGAAPRRAPPAPGHAIGVTRLDAGELVLYTGELVVLPAMESVEGAKPQPAGRARRRPTSKRLGPRLR